MPASIFLSYRREDTRGVAGRLVDSLRAYFGDDRVFRDVEGITGGAEFGSVIQDQLGEAQAAIVLMGASWIGATDGQGRQRLADPEDWVAREIAGALAKGIPIYPVLVDGAPMPRAEELPDSLRPLLRYNAVSVSDERWQTDVTRLAKILAMDMPGSADERTLERVKLAVSLSLAVGMSVTTATLVRNLFGHIRANNSDTPDEALLHGEQLLDLGMSGITFAAILVSSILLLVFARLVDPSKRRYVQASALVGIVGLAVSYVILDPVDSEYETIVNFLESTVIASTMFVLMVLSGFKPR